MNGGHHRSWRLIRRSTCVAILVAVALLYQNCAPAPSAPPEPNRSPASVEADVVEVFKAAQIDCADVSTYLCEIRSYGRDVADQSMRARECFGSVCVESLRLSFNTRQQIKTCSECSAEDIRERYEYREVKCMNRAIGVGRALPVAAEDAEPAVALEKAIDICKTFKAQAQAETRVETRVERRVGE